MTNLPPDLSIEQMKQWIEQRQAELNETLMGLQTVEKLEEEKIKQELYDMRIVRRTKGGKRSRGFGDTVEKAINKVTGGKVKSCGGCKKRRDALNKAFPYKKK